MRNSLFIFKPPNLREDIIDKCRECDKHRSIHNFKGCLYRVKQINLHLSEMEILAQMLCETLLPLGENASSAWPKHAPPLTL
jgi:hypothetical protein